MKRANTLSGKITRQKALNVVGAGAACVTLLNIPGCKEDRQKEGRQKKARHSRHSALAQPSSDVRAFRSRPELAPTVEITLQAHDTAPGYGAAR